MKSFSKIFMFLSLFVALSSCEKKPIGGGENNGGEEDIFMPSEGYIYFNINPATRGELIEDVLKGKNFNVVGYNYQSRWGAAIVQASQAFESSLEVNGESKPYYMGTFYYAKTDGNGVQLVDGVQLVEWVGDETSGVHTYTYNGPDKSEVGNYKQWDGNLIYSFFAWYPTNLEFNIGATKSDGTAIKPYDFEGNPYIRYTLPTGVGARAAMEDVMTACRIDVTKYNGSSVNFNMEHRLAALDILANSIITLKSLKEAWPDKDFTGLDNATITVENITDLKLKLNSIKERVKIPLNTNDDAEVMEASGSLTPTYEDFDCTDISIPYYSMSEDMKTLMGEDKLILIPQTEPIEAAMEIHYDVVLRVDGDVKMTIHYDRGNISDPTATKKVETTINGLEEKYYHYLELTFTASGVFLEARVDETWEPLDIKYSFE